jgi:hypothetical protein
MDADMLEHNGCGYVGHDPQGKNSSLGESASGKQVQQAENRIGGEGRRQHRSVDTGRGNMTPYTINDEDKKRKQYAFSKLNDLKNRSEAL